MNTSPAPNLLAMGYRNVEQQAKLFKSTRGTLANWRHKNVGPPYVEIAGRIYYPVDGTERYLAAKVITAGISRDADQR